MYIEEDIRAIQADVDEQIRKDKEDYKETLVRQKLREIIVKLDLTVSDEQFESAVSVIMLG